eukprot:scaffold290891_cov13-Prasinocladus_malaysianus.AAC.1
MSPLAVACEMLTGETPAAGQRQKTFIDLKVSGLGTHLLIGSEYFSLRPTAAASSRWQKVVKN